MKRWSQGQIGRDLRKMVESATVLRHPVPYCGTASVLQRYTVALVIKIWLCFDPCICSCGPLIGGSWSTWRGGNKSNAEPNLRNILPSRMSPMVRVFKPWHAHPLVLYCSGASRQLAGEIPAERKLRGRCLGRLARLGRTTLQVLVAPPPGRVERPAWRIIEQWTKDHGGS